MESNVWKVKAETMFQLENELVERAWHIIRIAEELEESEEVEDYIIDSLRGEFPNTYCNDWDTKVNSYFYGIEVNFHRTEAYEDWDEEFNVRFTWEEFNMDDQGIKANLIKNATELYEKQRLKEVQELTQLAKYLNYSVEKLDD